MSATPADRQPDLPARWESRALLGFVALGVVLRVARYLANYPLWWDEAFVGVNLLKRGYVDLLKPLDYAQVCPLLFLWAELTVVKLLGFSEWSLRLFPLACSVASVFLFRHAAGRVLRGVPLVLAVGIFAVSYHPIRHSADVKPYASDLLIALGLLAAALEWLREPGRAFWLWVLAAATPVALAASHPAIFVAGGVGLALALAVRTERRGIYVAYAGFLMSTTFSFVILYVLFTRAQASATLAGMSEQWATGFPPLGDPWALALWLARVHTGSVFAYPCGGERGASVLTFAAFLIGAGMLWRRGRRTTLSVLLAPFGLALLAAALRRYPFGGVTHGSPARVMQFLAPAVCILAGLGAAGLLARVASPGMRRRGLRLGLFTLVVVGVGPIAAELTHPYRSIQAERAREFARSFWPELARGGEPVCLRWDLGLGAWDSTDLNVAVYLCNQKIYSPARRTDGRKASATHPPRYVESLARPGDPVIAAWLESMTARHDLKSRRPIAIDTAEPGARPRSERYMVYEFASAKGRVSTPRLGPAGHASRLPPGR